jgi:biopolymer transport protein ExbD
MEMPSDAGFQIAPMIDVVFVIMLFFMVMAGAVKVEHELKTTLPGNAETAKETEMPDEITIGVAENGAITINAQRQDLGRPLQRDDEDGHGRQAVQDEATHHGPSRRGRQV